MLIAVTGAGGFVGSAVANRLEHSGHEVRRFTRRPSATCRAVPDIGDEVWWRSQLVGVEVVVHCAARVHVMRETADDPASAFHSVNVAGSAAVTRAAAAVGVRQLVFLSTIGVHGRPGETGAAVSEASPFAPRDPYAKSKLEAETQIKAVAAQTKLRYTILRPPLVVGPGAAGNLALLAKAIDKGLPLPLAGIQNERSLMALTDLVDLIHRCLTGPAALNAEFVLSGDEPLSTPAIVRVLSESLGRSARLFHVPDPLLRAAASLLGRYPAYEGLCRSLLVDSSRVRRTLNWSPNVSNEVALRAFAKTYRQVYDNG